MNKTKCCFVIGAASIALCASFAAPPSPPCFQHGSWDCVAEKCKEIDCNGEKKRVCFQHQGCNVPAWVDNDNTFGPLQPGWRELGPSSPKNCAAVGRWEKCDGSFGPQTTEQITCHTQEPKGDSPRCTNT